MPHLCGIDYTERRGRLRLELQWVSQAGANGGNVLRVRIIEARNLLATDFNGFSDPYVKLYLLPDPSKATKRKTAVVKKNLNPTFDEAFE